MQLCKNTTTTSSGSSNGNGSSNGKTPMAAALLPAHGIGTTDIDSSTRISKGAILQHTLASLAEASAAFQTLSYFFTAVHLGRLNSSACAAITLESCYQEMAAIGAAMCV
jgi:hypothetical protein